MLPDMVEQFLRKNENYPYDTELGPRAEIVELNRKMNKLKAAIWNGEKLDGEQPLEIIKDMHGHLFLLENLLLLEEGSPQVTCDRSFSSADWVAAYAELLDELRHIVDG